MLKLLVCTTLLFVTDVVVCKPDYLFNQEVNGWLKLHMVPATWQDAFLTCHYEGAMLASPINVQFATALRSIMLQSELSSSIYLGVHEVSARDFISIEGVSLADLSIIWGSYGNGETSGNCLTLSIDGKTYMSPDTLLLPFVCYKKRDNTTVFNECGTFDDEYHINHDTGSCYKYHEKPSSWWLAHKTCSAEGGHLVIINDNEEANIVATIMKNPIKTEKSDEPAHIGLRNWNQNESIWLTIHGEKIENVYNVWAPGQPDNKATVCGAMYPTATLDDIDCTYEQPFMCEKDPNTSRFENIFGEDFEAPSDASENNRCTTAPPPPPPTTTTQ